MKLGLLWKILTCVPLLDLQWRSCLDFSALGRLLLGVHHDRQVARRLGHLGLEARRMGEEFQKKLRVSWLGKWWGRWSGAWQNSLVGRVSVLGSLRL
jgi:hypothetical protein